MKIPKRLCFDPDVLRAWIHTKPKISDKALYEVLVILTMYRAYLDDVPGRYRVFFPVKADPQHHLGEMTYEDFFESAIEDDSAFDAVLIRDVNGDKPREIHCQIKQFGKGKEKGGTTDELIKFLAKYQNDDGKGVRLIVSLDGFSAVRPQKVFDWLNSTNYPYDEVVLIYMSAESDYFEFFQLKPNNGFTFAVKRIGRKDVVGK